MARETESKREKSASDQAQLVPEQAQRTHQASSPVSQKTRDKWDYLELLLRPASSFLTALTVALIGWFGQQALIEQSAQETARVNYAQQEETRRTEMAQNYRLYSELLSKREDAESALRRDMFTTILEKFFQVGVLKPGEADMSQRLLKLEMLALNFGESLSLSPLFVSLDHDIDQFPYPPELSVVSRSDDRDRLQSLAKRVADQQLSALSGRGKIWEFTVPLVSIIGEGTTEGSYRWPDDDPDFEEGVEERINDVQLEGMPRTYRFEFSEADRTYKSVHVFLEIRSKTSWRLSSGNLISITLTFPWSIILDCLVISALPLF